MSEKRAETIKKCVDIATAVFTVASGVCLVCACIAVYIGGNGNYTRDAVVSALGWVSIPISVWLALAVAGWLCHLLLPGGAKKRIAGQKGAMKKGKESPKAVFAVRIGLIAIGLGILIAGAATGGMADVLAKAVKLCTECVGLG